MPKAVAGRRLLLLSSSDDIPAGAILLLLPDLLPNDLAELPLDIRRVGRSSVNTTSTRLGSSTSTSSMTFLRLPPRKELVNLVELLLDNLLTGAFRAFDDSVFISCVTSEIIYVMKRSWLAEKMVKYYIYI